MIFTWGISPDEKMIFLEFPQADATQIWSLWHPNHPVPTRKRGITALIPPVGRSKLPQTSSCPPQAGT
jgi:hypothetical protein